jgi:radical SAM protein with 4Fe4S-binding SPASM domain
VRRTHSIAQQVNLRASKKNIPLSVLVELTYRCNLNCYYCYQKNISPAKELSLRQWSRVLRGLSECGTFYLTFSGGEPLLRRDFIKIIEVSRTYDFAVSVITNGTLLAPPLIRSLASLGVMDIGISFHAASATLHDRLSGAAGSFDKAYDALCGCAEAGIKALIKHSVSKRNFGEFRKLRKMADDIGVLFECDCFVLPQAAGRASPCSLEQGQYLSFLKAIKAVPSPCPTKSDIAAQLNCDAGRSVAGIRPDGEVVPCVLLDIPFGSLTSSSFGTIWHSSKALRFRKQEKTLSAECRQCVDRRYCSRCHGMARLESSDFRGKSPSLCAYAGAVNIFARNNSVTNN